MTTDAPNIAAMSLADAPKTAGHRCEACGDPATRQDVEGVWLCQGDYDHLAETWHLEGFAIDDQQI